MEKFNRGGRQEETLENHDCRINPLDPREGSNDSYKYFGCAFTGCNKTVTYVTSEGTNTDPVWKLEEGQYDNNPEIGNWREGNNPTEGEDLLPQ